MNFAIAIALCGFVAFRASAGFSWCLCGHFWRHICLGAATTRWRTTALRLFFACCAVKIEFRMNFHRLVGGCRVSRSLCGLCWRPLIISTTATATATARCLFDFLLLAIVGLLVILILVLVALILVTLVLTTTSGGHFIQHALIMVGKLVKIFCLNPVTCLFGFPCLILVFFQQLLRIAANLGFVAPVARTVIATFAAFAGCRPTALFPRVLILFHAKSLPTVIRD